MLDKFETFKKIKSVRAPILILHGERDTIIPVSYGRALYNMSPDPKEVQFIPDAGHNDLYDHGAAGYVVQFVEKLFTDNND